jgi:hypothetical protein
MKGHARDKTSIQSAWIWSNRTWGKMIALLVLGLPLPAFAALGAYEDSVQDDRVRLQAQLKTTAAGAYTIHELTSPLGIVVREYVSPAGRVFAVSWQGTFLPDMKQILGSYFGQYSLAAKQERESQAKRSALDIHKPSLVVQSAGHLRAYYGRVYDPRLLPAGVTADDLR